MLDNRHSVVFFATIRSIDVVRVARAIEQRQVRQGAGWDWDALKRAWLRLRRKLRNDWEEGFER